MSYVKKIMEIGSSNNSIQTEDVMSIEGDFDMDALCGILTFQLPYFILLPDSNIPQYTQPQAGVNTNELKKYDTVKLYFGEFDTDPGNVSPGQLTKIFDGYIDQIKLSKSKNNINYAITALGTLGLGNDRNMEYQRKVGSAKEMMLTMLQTAGLQKGKFNVTPVSRDLIPQSMVRFIDVEDAETWIWSIDGGETLKDALESIKKKYAIIIHQSGDGYVNITTPFSLLSAKSNEVLSVNAWQFDVSVGNVYEVDYGDLTNMYNAVVILGNPPTYGVAVDPIAVSNNDGQVNYLIFENRKLFSDEECQRTARNKLLELERNYFVSFRTKFDPRFMVGQPFNLKDNDRYSGTETLMIKSYKFKIDKNDVSCTVTGFAHGATLVPEDVALSDIGVLDVDILQIRDKEFDATTWKEIGGS